MIEFNPLIMAGIVLVFVGILYTLVSARAGIVVAGLGTVTAGVFLFSIGPNALNPIAFFFTGLLVLCGLWMVDIGARKECAGR